MPNRDFSAHAVLVTGAAKGIGRGVAGAFVAAGASVTMLDLDDEALRATAEELGGEGGRAVPITGSVSDPAAVERAVAMAVERYGRLDVVVNCAGVVRYGDVESLSVEDWELQLDTNLKSVFLTSKFAAPHLRAASGVIVSIASVQAFVTQMGVPAYTASKGGIVALTRSLALDFADDGVRAVALAPGSVDTPMLRWSAAVTAGDEAGVDEVIEEWGRNHPLGRVVTVDDVVNAVLFLASDEAAMITGTTLTIDGGLIAQVAVNR